MDSRTALVAIIFGLGAAYALMAFTVSWLRSTPQERDRWKYHGRHVGTSSLVPEPPRDAEVRRPLARRQLAAMAAAGGAVLIGGSVIRYLNVGLGLLIFVIGIAVSARLRWQVMQGLGWVPHRGRRRRDRR